MQSFILPIEDQFGNLRYVDFGTGLVSIEGIDGKALKISLDDYNSFIVIKTVEKLQERINAEGIPIVLKQQGGCKMVEIYMAPPYGLRRHRRAQKTSPNAG